MTIIPDTLNNWRVVRIRAAGFELVVGISAGPRILALAYQGGSNLLYEDHTNFGVGDWLLYGGHRFTVAPESAASYLPDNTPCEVSAGDGYTRISSPVREDSARLTLSVRPSRSFAGFEIDHEIMNTGSSVWHGAPWAITCVPRNTEVTAFCNQAPVRYWPGTDPASFELAGSLLQPAPGPHRSKAGWHQLNGWLAAVQPLGSLVIRNPEHSEPGDCTDDGCNMELFVCPDFIELETVGKLVSLPPGRSVSHRQHWQVYAPGISI